jgi:CheY-like chemotaxis protein/HPt (histidine-containing phosphotransfer) domain-containing protein
VRIINEVLDFSKLQSGKMKLGPVHFLTDTVVNEIRWLFENKAKEKNIEFTIEKDEKIPFALHGDVVRLKQILINLIANAIKFTKEGSVKVKLRVEKLNDRKILLFIDVQDTGIGIDKKNLANIFDDFSQAGEETTRKYGGTGLGLSIVKKLIDLQKGSIAVESILNKGSKFTCKIPFEIGDKNMVEETIAVSVNVPDEIRKIKVLIADDEVYNRKLISSILKKWDIAHDEAVDGQQSIEMAKNGNYDFIILDKQMPVADGFEVTKYIRQSLGRTKDETVIIMSSAASVSNEDMLAYKSLGIDAYLPKPFTEELLLETLTRFIQKGENSPKVQLAKSGEISGPTSQDLNLDELHRFSGNDLDFVKEMLVRFIESFETGWIEIEQALLVNEMGNIRNIAHKIASPCRHIGAGKLLVLIKKIETQAETNTAVVQIKETFEEAGNEYQIVKKQINEHIDNLNSEPKV